MSETIEAQQPSTTVTADDAAQTFVGKNMSIISVNGSLLKRQEHLKVLM